MSAPSRTNKVFHSAWYEKSHTANTKEMNKEALSEGWLAHVGQRAFDQRNERGVDNPAKAALPYWSVIAFFATRRLSASTKVETSSQTNISFRLQ